MLLNGGLWPASRGPQSGWYPQMDKESFQAPFDSGIGVMATHSEPYPPLTVGGGERPAVARPEPSSGGFWDNVNLETLIAEQDIRPVTVRS